MKIKIGIILLVLILIISCDVPSKDRVKKEFLYEYPTYTVMRVWVGEGDSDHSCFHIRYKKPNDEKIYEDRRLYKYSDQDQKWINTNHTCRD